MSWMEVLKLAILIVWATFWVVLAADYLIDKASTKYLVTRHVERKGMLDRDDFR